MPNGCFVFNLYYLTKTFIGNIWLIWQENRNVSRRRAHRKCTYIWVFSCALYPYMSNFYRAPSSTDASVLLLNHPYNRQGKMRKIQSVARVNEPCQPWMNVFRFRLELKANGLMEQHTTHCGNDYSLALPISTLTSGPYCLFFPILPHHKHLRARSVKLTRKGNLIFILFYHKRLFEITCRERGEDYSSFLSQLVWDFLLETDFRKVATTTCTNAFLVR